jgi:hypothetical protein
VRPLHPAPTEADGAATAPPGLACQPERGVPPVPVGPWTRRVAIFARARGGLTPGAVGVAHSPRRAAPARRRPQREEWVVWHLNMTGGRPSYESRSSRPKVVASGRLGAPGRPGAAGRARCPRLPVARAAGRWHLRHPTRAMGTEGGPGVGGGGQLATAACAVVHTRSRPVQCHAQ